MLGWIFGKKENKLEEETKKGFSAVKKDMDVVGKWVKHLDERDKQLFSVVEDLKQHLSSIHGEVINLRERVDEFYEGSKNKQVFEKEGILDKQTAVYDVEEAVQTAVQTGNFYEIFKGLSSNERLVLFTIMNSDMKLSYEDLALLLGKERSTIRGQVNTIKQKSEGLIEEITEKNGKKRVYVPAEIKEKLMKYAKVRVGKGKKGKKEAKND
ncbi:hypothetical protein COU54_04795 [Candidatus Pacearchaeota archaeon CG10_big_fil_rev_8_21_14_0_10_31_24]|nr:MAG: hypothetical protein COU54_04795 [Candidatus Pacearchaeota archaeon CG10_big_fil_rev_8_21_14_0_10_31_24]